MFIPTTSREVRRMGWDALDIILVSGDTYADTPYNGTALIGHWLIDRGYRVGIIAQPRTDSPDDIARLGMPELFWSVSAGCVDSMVANYTPTRKFRKEDDFTPGGANDRRPDRATIAYTNLIKKHAKGKPVFLAGIEASLRRIAHYDYWSDSVRRSVLFDSKADGIIYGMAELATLEVARRIRDGGDWKDVPGICYASKERPLDAIEMPSFDEVRDDRAAFMSAFRIFRDNCDPITAKPLCQLHGDRYLVQNRPQRALTSEELDSLYGSDFEDAVHPYYAKDGHVKAMDTVRNSITTHRGCYGNCSFCAISAHQGTTVVSRSEGSILREAERIASRPGFNGVIQDVGGPTANMYGIECRLKTAKGRCADRRCLGKNPCPRLPIDHSRQISLLKKISEVPGVKKVFVSSGIRYDMIAADKANGQRYLQNIVNRHVSGQMKVAPEHISDGILDLMGKPHRDSLDSFRQMFSQCVRESGKDLYLTYYFMAAHPGCREEDMDRLSSYCSDRLRIRPEQVQVFTPTPSTYSTAMYVSGTDSDGKSVFVEKSVQKRQRQKEAVTKGKRHGRSPESCLRPLLRAGMVLRPEEGGLLRVARNRLQARRPSVRLPRRRPGPSPAGPLPHDRAALQEEGMVCAPVVFRLPPVGGVHRFPQADVHLQEQEPGQDLRRAVRGSLRFRSEAPRHGPPGRFRHRELIPLLDQEAEHAPRGLLQHGVQGGGDILEAGHARCARKREGLCGLPRMPPPPPGLPSRREGARQPFQELGARVSRMVRCRSGIAQTISIDGCIGGL